MLDKSSQRIQIMGVAAAAAAATNLSFNRCI